MLGDAGEALGDSLYEAKLFVRGSVKSLGADCIEKPMRPEHLAHLRRAPRPRRASPDVRPRSSAATARRAQLYNFNIDNADAY